MAAIKVEISELNPLLNRIIGENGQSALKKIESTLQKVFLPAYKNRIFNRGENTAEKQLPPLKRERPKFARAPGGKRRIKVKYRTAPLYLYRSGTLFKSITLRVVRGRIIIQIKYPEIIIDALEKRYGAIFIVTEEEINFLSDVISRLITQQLTA